MKIALKSNNEINIWNLKGLKNVSKLSGHNSRVLYLALSPDGKYMVSGAGDETLRFWNVFPTSKNKSIGGQSSLSSCNIDLR